MPRTAARESGSGPDGFRPNEAPTVTNPDGEKPPVLLTIASYMGTLAAARHYGLQGVPVYIADPRSVAPSLWSRHTRRRLTCPLIWEPAAFLQWLLDFGAKEPGAVLYPTSDETAWLFSRHQDRLGQHYRLYSPPAETLARILNKKKLHDSCTALGIATPLSLFPEDDTTLKRIAGTLPYPTLIKARTQIFWPGKGQVVSSPEELVKAFLVFRDTTVNHAENLTGDPFLSWPMIQAFYAEAAENIYSLSGFIDESGEAFVVRASRKVLQYPRRVGIGLCFEAVPVNPDLREKVHALCRATGFYGVFEAEFIQRREDGEFLLIDFNPRYYNQMAFDIDRGMPLPEMVYQAAIGNREKLFALICRANANTTNESSAYCYRWKFSFMLRLLRMLNRISPEEMRYWHSWLQEYARANRITDPVFDPADRLPSIIDATNAIYSWIRHPRSFIKEMFIVLCGLLPACGIG